jgi:DNA mismatch endonuclease, patch repair protein
VFSAFSEGVQGNHRVDRLTPLQRSGHMSRIRRADTRPEVQVRTGLHAAGLRFRLHRRDLPGRPDIVLSRHSAVIFVHGCFWHGHEGCRLAVMPKTRRPFWKEKFRANRERDLRQKAELLQLGWRVLVVWECSVRSPRIRTASLAAIVRWVRSSSVDAEVSG